MDSSTRQALKAKAHHINPVILIGAKGLTPEVINETNVALTAHELIKIKMNSGEKADRKAFAEEICQQLQADLVQLIGNVAILYRKNPEI